MRSVLQYGQGHCCREEETSCRSGASPHASTCRFARVREVMKGYTCTRRGNPAVCGSLVADVEEELGLALVDAFANADGDGDAGGSGVARCVLQAAVKGFDERGGKDAG